MRRRKKIQTVPRMVSFDIKVWQELRLRRTILLDLIVFSWVTGNNSRSVCLLLRCKRFIPGRQTTIRAGLDPKSDQFRLGLDHPQIRLHVASNGVFVVEPGGWISTNSRHFLFSSLWEWIWSGVCQVRSIILRITSLNPSQTPHTSEISVKYTFFFRYFEAGNFRGIVRSKVEEYLVEKMGRPKEDFIFVPVYTRQDIDLRVLKNDSISRAVTGAPESN